MNERKRRTLAELLDSTPDDAVNMPEECVHKSDKLEQEPWPSVQCVCGGAIYFKYTPPVSDYHEGWEEGFKAAKREWVGLTDNDIEDEWRFLEAIYIEEVDPEGYWGSCNFEFARAIEAKLKEKNA